MAPRPAQAGGFCRPYLLTKADFLQHDAADRRAAFAAPISRVVWRGGTRRQCRCLDRGRKPPYRLLKSPDLKGRDDHQRVRRGRHRPRSRLGYRPKPRRTAKRVLCCTVRDDLMQTLSDLCEQSARREIPAFGRVIIETTGLADSVPIIATLLTDPTFHGLFRLDSVVTTVDASTVMTTLGATRGIRQADRSCGPHPSDQDQPRRPRRSTRD